MKLVEKRTVVRPSQELQLLIGQVHELCKFLPKLIAQSSRNVQPANSNLTTIRANVVKINEWSYIQAVFIKQEVLNARLREHESAISFYDRAMGVTPDDGYIYFHKARSLGELGRTHEQARVLKQGIEAAARAGDAKAAGELRAALEDLE